jgi:transcriptional regulator with XRE-family HTH domain
MELGRTIIIRRTMLGMGRKDVAQASGISYPYLAEIEAGVKDPSMGRLLSLAEALQFPTLSAMFAWGEALQAFEEAHQ